MTHRFWGLQMLLLVPAFFGCAGPSVIHVEHPAPARPAASVEVLLDMPERPFRTVAVIRSPHENRPFRNVEKLKRQVIAKAAELGADAVVLSFWGGGGSADGAGVTHTGEIVLISGSQSALHVVGRAIRYAEPPPTEDQRSDGAAGAILRRSPEHTRVKDSNGQ